MPTFRFSTLLFAAILLYGINACTQQTTENQTAGKNLAHQRWQSRLDSLLEAHAEMSTVLLVADSGEIVYEKARGYRNFTDKTSLQTSDIFELASVSKQFTAMATVLLAESGELGYEDTLGQYLPQLPYPSVTIRQMLVHTSGLPDYMALFQEHWDKTKVANNADIIDYLTEYHPPMLFAPGEKYTYSNTAYCLLASISEQVSGQGFEQFSADRIFAPLGMESTAIRSTEEKKQLPNFAQGFIYDAEKKTYLPAESFPESDYNFYLGGRIGPGRVSSNAYDLLKWDQALYGEEFVSQATLEQEVFAPYTLNNGEKSQYGFGWLLEASPGYGRKVWHDGDNPGYRTGIVRYLDKKITVILLCNNQYSPFLQVLDDIEAILIEEGKTI